MASAISAAAAFPAMLTQPEPTAPSGHRIGYIQPSAHEGVATPEEAVMAKKNVNYILVDLGHRGTQRAARSRPAFRYKQPRQPKLQPTEQTFGTLRSLASRMCTQKEAAAILQVHVDTLQKFFRANPEAREAWGEGKELGRAQLRMLLWQQAVDNPAQARFLAKQKLGLGIETTPPPPKPTSPSRTNLKLSASQGS